MTEGDSLYKLGKTAEYNDDYDVALEYFKAAMSMDPQPCYLGSIIRARYMLQQYEEVRKVSRLLEDYIGSRRITYYLKALIKTKCFSLR